MGALDGKVALVTGAGSGIGRAATVALAAAGASVVANDLVPDGLDDTVAAIESARGAVAAVTGDVRRRGDVASAIEAARSRFGGLDVVVANPPSRSTSSSSSRARRRSTSCWTRI